jgi:hypothetical protein
MCTWYAMTTGRAAPIAGTVLGVLYGLQMVLFFSSDVITGEPLKLTLEDGFGLLAAIAILTGAVRGLRNRGVLLLDSGQGADYAGSPNSK